MSTPHTPSFQIAGGVTCPLAPFAPLAVDRTAVTLLAALALPLGGHSVLVAVYRHLVRR